MTSANEVTLPAKLSGKLDDIAAEMNRPRDSIVEEALAAWLDREERRHQLTLEGLADIAAGRVVDHVEVKRWAESLGTDNPLPLPGP